MSQRVTPSAEIKRLCFFFGFAYFAQGLGQDQSGIISQPIKYYLTKTLAMSSSQVAAFTYWLILPWMIKPLYGLISDLLPVAGYRRKSYLVLGSGLAFLAFLLILLGSGPTVLWIGLFCAALGIAFGDVLVDALMVENGQRTGFLRFFQGVQWQWVGIAGVASALIGGLLCQRFTGPLAIRGAALLAMLPMLGLLLSAFRLVREEPVTSGQAARKNSLRGLGQALRSKTLWKMAVILVLVQFAPGLGISYYTYETTILQFPESFVGIEGAVGAVGAVVGAFLFNRLLAGRGSQRRLLTWSLVAAGCGTLLYLLIPVFRTTTVALIVSPINGALGMFAALALLSLAGEACPAYAEGFTFAGLMSLFNFAAKTGERFGAILFDRFHQDLRPLTLISAATTFLALVLVPLLPSAEEPRPTEEAAPGSESR